MKIYFELPDDLAGQMEAWRAASPGRTKRLFLAEAVREKLARERRPNDAPATAGSNVVLIEPDLAALFPDGDSVNRALRLLAETARIATASERRRRSR